MQSMARPRHYPCTLRRQELAQALRKVEAELPSNDGVASLNEEQLAAVCEAVSALIMEVSASAQSEVSTDTFVEIGAYEAKGEMGEGETEVGRTS